MRLRRQHPNLFAVLVLDVVCAFGSGLGLAFGPADWRRAPSFAVIGAVVPIRIHGLLFMMCAAVVAAGMVSTVRVMRAGLVALGVLTSFWAFGLVLSAMNGKITGAPGFFLFTYFAGSCFVQASEPVENPATAKR